MFRLKIFIILIPLSLSAVDKSFESFLNKYFISCHEPKKEKGDLRIDTITRDFKPGVDSRKYKPDPNLFESYF